MQELSRKSKLQKNVSSLMPFLQMANWGTEWLSGSPRVTQKACGGSRTKPYPFKQRSRALTTNLSFLSNAKCNFFYTVAADLTGIRVLTTEKYIDMNSITVALQQWNKQTAISYPLRGNFQYAFTLIPFTAAPFRWYKSGKVVSVGLEPARWWAFSAYSTGRRIQRRAVSTVQAYMFRFLCLDMNTETLKHKLCLTATLLIESNPRSCVKIRNIPLIFSNTGIHLSSLSALWENSENSSKK